MVDPGKVPVAILECTQCKGRKTIVYLGANTISKCGRCGAELINNPIVDMIIQGDVVLYRLL